MSAIIWMKISLFLFLPIHSLLSCKMPWISRLSLTGSDCRIIEECLNQPIHGVTGRNQSSNVLFNKVKFNFTPKKFQISHCIVFHILYCWLHLERLVPPPPECSADPPDSRDVFNKSLSPPFPHLALFLQ